MKKVAIIGLGVLGCYSILEILKSVNFKLNSDFDLCLFDFDKVEKKNINRQIFYSKLDVGKYKTKAAKSFLKNKFSDLNFDTINSKVNSDNISDILKPFDLILDCSDNYNLRQILDDYCYLNKKLWIYAGINKDVGVVATFDYTSGFVKSAKFQNMFQFTKSLNTDSGTTLAAKNIAKIQADYFIKSLDNKALDFIEYIDFSSGKKQKFKIF